MDFKCFSCSDFFESYNETIDHLRKTHNVKESKNSKISCVVNQSKECTHKFQTFSGLRKHIIKCFGIKGELQ